MNRKAVSLVLGGAMLISAVSGMNAGAEEAATEGKTYDSVTLTLYSPGNENSVPTKAIVKYGELLEEASNGSITCDVHFGGDLGDDANSIESTRMGTIDVIFAGTSGFTSFYDKAKVLDLPFLFTSAEEANEIVNSEIGEQILMVWEIMIWYSFPKVTTVCAIFPPPATGSRSNPQRMWKD